MQDTDGEHISNKKAQILAVMSSQLERSAVVPV